MFWFKRAEKPKETVDVGKAKLTIYYKNMHGALLRFEREFKGRVIRYGSGNPIRWSGEVCTRTGLAYAQEFMDSERTIRLSATDWVPRHRILYYETVTDSHIEEV